MTTNTYCEAGGVFMGRAGYESAPNGLDEMLSGYGEPCSGEVTPWGLDIDMGLDLCENHRPTP